MVSNKWREVIDLSVDDFPAITCGAVLCYRCCGVCRGVDGLYTEPQDGKDAYDDYPSRYVMFLHDVICVLLISPPYVKTGISSDSYTREMKMQKTGGSSVGWLSFRMLHTFNAICQSEKDM